MQARRIRSSTALLSVLAVLTLAAPAFAVEILDDPMQIDERAAQLVQASNSLCWEMHRFHQQQPGYQQSYRAAKEVWSRTGDLRDALWAGPVETAVLNQRLAELNGLFAQVEKSVSTWGNGDRSSVALHGRPALRTIVTPGAEVDIPFIGGLRVGAPQVVVTEDGPPQLERRRLHPNSHGSRRSLERELAAVKVALTYLLEDAGVPAQTDSPAPDAPAATETAPRPPVPPPALGDPQKIVPSSTKEPADSTDKNPPATPES